MTYTSRTIVRRVRGRLGMVAAVLGMAAGVMTAAAVAVPAFAATIPAAASASPAPTDITSADIAETANSCTSYYRWEASTSGDYSRVKWTSNPCGFQIQERSGCSNSLTFNWSTSGIVVGVNLWDESSCDTQHQIITRGEVHFNHEDGTGWTTYKTFWQNPGIGPLTP